MADPAIILVSEHHADTLLEEFRSRYQRDYDLHTAGSCTEAESIAREIRDRGDHVALFVTDSRLPDVDRAKAFHRWRLVVANARRVVAAHWDYFLADGPALRAGMAKGKYDAYLLMPRGKRDEEFHNAITDLLSEWTSTVPQPEVVVAKVISPTQDALTMAIRDFLDRMGMQNGSATPTTRSSRTTWPGSGQSSASRARWPVVVAADRAPIQATSVRDVAIAINGATQLRDRRGRRPRGRRRRAGRAGRGGLRRVRGAVGRRAGGRGDRRPGRHQLDDPQLPRLPARHLRDAAGAARPQPGPALRDRVLHRVGGDRPGAGHGRHPHLLRTDGGDVRARTVLISSGVAYRKLGVPPLEELVGAGVNYGAAMTAAREMEGYDVVVVGGGNSAGQAALYLARFARSVTIVVRRPGLEETMSKYLIDEIGYNERIEVLPCTRVVDGGGEGQLEWLCLEDTTTGERTTSRRADCSCCSAPSRAATGCRRSWRATSNSFVLTGRDVPRDQWVDDVPPANLATTVPGIFAAGDIRAGSMKRVASASGEGASVVPLVHAYLAPATEDEVVPAPVS